MKNKINIITIISCVLVVAIFACLFLVIPDRKISDAENRTLKTVPSFSIDKLMSGSYTAELGEYISDQFPARDTFVALKAYCELLLGKRENNGVIYGKNNTLIAKTQWGDNLKENLNSVKEFENAVNIPVYVGILPSTMDVYSEKLPKTYSTNYSDELWQQFFTESQNLDLKTVNLYSPLCKHSYYYRTDHHYTSYGAYTTYTLLGDTIGYKSKTTDFFNTEIVSNSFCGTSMRSSGFYLAPKDDITLFRYDGDTDYTVTADGKQIELYDFSRLETADQYAVFLGGNHARVDITSSEKKPKILIIRDSFADALAPFLAIHYDITLIDLRYYNDSVQQLVKNENFDSVLILECITEFSSTKNLSYLRMAE